MYTQEHSTLFLSLHTHTHFHALCLSHPLSQSHSCSPFLGVVFSHLRLQAYKIAKGKIWPLITLLCMFAGIVSAFLVSLPFAVFGKMEISLYPFAPLLFRDPHFGNTALSSSLAGGSYRLPLCVYVHVPFDFSFCACQALIRDYQTAQCFLWNCILPARPNEVFVSPNIYASVLSSLQVMA